jgi:adenylate kinase family enzyme
MKGNKPLLSVSEFLSSQRILIIGNGGSGKSTLALTLGKITGLPIIHLDQLYWQAGWKNVDREVFLSKLETEMEKEKWIIDGNYRSTLPLRLLYCDLIIYLDFNRFVSLWSVIKRIIKHHGKTRPDMAPGCPERFDWTFLKWVWSFNRENRDYFYNLLSTCLKPVMIFRTRKSLKKFLKTLV